MKVFAAGFPAWKKFAGASGVTQAAQVKSGAEEGSIDIATFKGIIAKNPESIYLVDVRDPDEFKTGSFKTAVNIPTDKLEKEIPKLPTDKPIVFVCNTGARSGEAFYMVQDVRPKLKNVFYLEAECTYKKDGSVDIKPTS